jgi:hypothetical protein
MKKKIIGFISFILIFSGIGWPNDGFISRFSLESSDIELHRLAQPTSYFDKAGRKFAILGWESGSFEAWAYPLKILRNFELSFLVGSSTQPILGRDIVRSVSTTPAATTLTFVFQSFTVKAVYVASIDEPGAVILLAVDTTEPLVIVCSFIPVLQPMWPAGLGGQYAAWDDHLKAYIISEPTRKNHGFVGSPAAEGISYTPAHMLSDSPNQFKIAIEGKDAARDKYVPVIIAGGKGKREEIRNIYEKLAADPEAVYRKGADHYRRLRLETLRIKTPERDIDLAFEWAKIAYDNLIVDNPDLGKGLVAGLGTSGTGGRPGFGWFFGGDAFMNSLSLSSYGGFEDVKDALRFAQKWQRQDGKMAHELSQAAGYIDWFKDYPYAYIHGDTTPFYIIACEDYVRTSGDTEFVKQSWPSIKRAYDWCLTTDADGDGLMDNSRAGLGALEFGSLTGIQTDIFLAAAWTRAAYAMERLARIAADAASEGKARQDFAKAARVLEAKFWNGEKGQYSYAFNAGGGQVKDLTPWSAVALAWGLGEPKHGRLMLEKINGAELTTDWGVRMLSSKSSLYEPLNYNYGAVWPFLTGWVATALFKHNFVLQGFTLLEAAVRHTFDHGLGCVTELFSGHQNIWPQEAVAHQGFSSSAVVFPLVRGLLGLEGDAVERRILLEPRFPANWKEVSVENFRLGKESFSFRYKRSDRGIRLEIAGRPKGPIAIFFAPVLGLGTRALRARVNGRNVPFRGGIEEGAQAFQPAVEAELSGDDVIEIDLEPAAELLPLQNPSRTGDLNSGLKIIRMGLQGKKLEITVEGLSGALYEVRIVQPDLLRAVEGAQIEGEVLRFRIPEAVQGGFVCHPIILSLK